MKKNLCVLVGTAVTICGFIANPLRPADPRPNVILVVADDLGLQLGCYGDRMARTPHLDGFAQQSLLCRNASVPVSSCSPSRAALMSGLYPHQNGQIGLSHRGFSMSQNFPTIPALLKKNGYLTAVLGKIHMKPLSAFPFDWQFGGADTRDKGDKEPLATVVLPNGKTETRKVPISKIPGVITDTLAAWLSRLSDGRTPAKPFFMMVNLLDPHLPHFNQINGQPTTFQPGGSVPIFPFVTDPQTINANDVAGHYNDVARLDGVFGTFIANLKQQGLYDNSLIIFIGDNGPDFDRAKATCYEAGLRVPMLVKMPGQTTGQTTDELVSTLDIFPTIAQALNLPVQKLNLQGIALQKLTNKATRSLRDYSFGEFIFHSDNHLLPTRSVKDKQYKLIVSPLTSFYAQQLIQNPANFSKQPWFPKYAKMPAIQLYDLKADPTEKMNRAGDPKLVSVQKRLESALQNWQGTTADSLFTTQKLKSYEPEIIRILNQPATATKSE